MRTKAFAAVTELAARLLHRPVGHTKWPGFLRDIDEPHLLIGLAALVVNRFINGDNEISLAVLALLEVLDFHVEQWQHRMRAAVGREFEPRNLRIIQILARDFLRPGEQFLAINNLQNTELVVAVAHVKTILLRPR